MEKQSQEYGEASANQQGGAPASANHLETVHLEVELWPVQHEFPDKYRYHGVLHSKCPLDVDSVSFKSIKATLIRAGRKELKSCSLLHAGNTESMISGFSVIRGNKAVVFDLWFKDEAKGGSKDGNMTAKQAESPGADGEPLFFSVDVLRREVGKVGDRQRGRYERFLFAKAADRIEELEQQVKRLQEEAARVAARNEEAAKTMRQRAGQSDLALIEAIRKQAKIEASYKQALQKLDSIHYHMDQARHIAFWGVPSPQAEMTGQQQPVHGNHCQPA